MSGSGPIRMIIGSTKARLKKYPEEAPDLSAVTDPLATGSRTQITENRPGRNIFVQLAVFCIYSNCNYPGPTVNYFAVKTARQHSFRIASMCVN
jgi:hypothetical protein